MFHLFNKIYLHFDDDINLNYDRVVISELNGVPVFDLLKKSVKGKLIDFKNNFEDFNFTNLIETLYNHGELSNKKVIVYCDKINYSKFITKWLKLILPNLNLESYKQYIKLLIYRERLIASNIEGRYLGSENNNTYWSSYEVFENLDNIFKNTIIFEEETIKIKSLDLKYSYEFLLSSYFSGSQKHLNLLKSTSHCFLRRWFLEILKDNRNHLFYNILNNKFKSGLNYEDSDVDFYHHNPIKNIPSLKYFSDESIWLEDKIKLNNFNYVNLVNLTQEQIDGLKNLFFKIFNISHEIEGVELKQYEVGIFNFFEYVTKNEITTSELNSLLDFVMEYPMDVLLIPKFDFHNVNVVFMSHIFNLKKENDIEKISKFQLL
jgi:hypothetical protein